MKLRILFISIAACCMILAVYSAVKQPGSRYREAKKEIVLRKLAHEIMLSAGDSVSRVLPVKQISKDEFQVFPENELAIVPDSFVNIVNRAITAGNLTGSFTANIIKYQQTEPVYGFAASPVGKDNVLTCIGRKLPKDRYYLSFIFSPGDQHQFYTAAFYLIGAMLVLTAFIFFFRKKGKQEVSPEIAPVNDQMQEADGLVKIGHYLFHPGQQWLELNGEKTALTVKESKLLQIFSSAPNTIIDRDAIQKEVWENEGVIVTRSLDVFISKLRKKLSNDPEIKIVNVHSRGYKLEVNS